MGVAFLIKAVVQKKWFKVEEVELIMRKLCNMSFLVERV